MKSNIVYLFVILFITLLLISFVDVSDAARKKKKSKRNSIVSDFNAKDVEDDETLTDTESFINKGDIKVIKSQESLKEHMEEIQKKNKNTMNDELDPNELAQMRKDETMLRWKAEMAKDEHGRMSAEYATALHRLGGNIYKQGRYDEVLATAKEIVKIHETVDGPEHINTAKALTNIGSVANRLGNLKECELAMNRALYILIKTYGKESKEVSPITLYHGLTYLTNYFIVIIRYYFIEDRC
jgi:hypothetical protein